MKWLIFNISNSEATRNTWWVSTSLVSLPVCAAVILKLVGKILKWSPSLGMIAQKLLYTSMRTVVKITILQGHGEMPFILLQRIRASFPTSQNPHKFLTIPLPLPHTQAHPPKYTHTHTQAGRGGGGGVKIL